MEEVRVLELERRVDALSHRVTVLEAHGRAAAPAASRPWSAVPEAAPTAPPAYWAPSPSPSASASPAPGSDGPAAPSRAGYVGAPVTPSRLGSTLTPSRVLALAGGLILLLGIGYLVRFAVAQGWLGPEVRIALALLTSGVIGGVGVRLERRDETRAIGQICTVTGVAGTYTAVVAATVGYRLLPDGLGLILAAGVAAAAVVRGVWARGQWIAALGVGGALAAPAIVNAVPAGITLALLVVLLAGGLWVAVRQDWPAISALAFLLVTPQLWAVAERPAPLVVALGLVTVCGVLFFAAAIAHTRSAAAAASLVPVVVVLNAVSLAGTGWALLEQLSSVHAAWWVAATGAVHLLGAALAGRIRQHSAVATMAGVCGFAGINVAVLILLDGHPVLVAFFSLLGFALLASRLLPELREVARAGVVVQLAAVAGHGLTVALNRPAAGSLEALLVVIAFCAVAVVLPLWARHLGEGIALAVALVPLGLAATRLLTVEAPLHALLDGPADLVAALGMCLALAAAMGALGALLQRRFYGGAVAVANYGVSLAAVAMDPDGVGRVALTGLWATGGAAALIAGRVCSRVDLRRAGAALLVAALTKALFVDTVTLDGTNRAVALLLCGTVLVGTAVVEARAAGNAPPRAPLAQ